MFFILSHVQDKEKIVSHILFTNMMLTTLLIPAVCRTSVTELCNKPHSLQSLCGSLIEHQTPESQDLRFDSTWGLRSEFFLCCDKTKNIFLYFFTKLKTYHLSYSIKEICIYQLRKNESESEKFAFFFKFLQLFHEFFINS